MTPTRSATLHLLRTIGIALIIIIVLSYVIWRSLDYIRGPRITIFEPAQNTSLATSTVTVHGQAERINNINFNGSPLSIDEMGKFSQRAILFPDLNIFTIVAHDVFGREIRSELRIVSTTELPL
jgi:hypothetical protein